MPIKHIKTFFATTFQTIFNQVLGLALFILLANYVTKNNFGDLNWAVAVSYTICTILTFGFDYIIVKKIAQRGNAQKTAGVYLSHMIIVSLIMTILLILHRTLFPGFYIKHQLLFAVFIASLFSFISSPYKQLANGTEKYWHFAIMNLVGNFVKVSGLIVLFLNNNLGIFSISVLYILSGIIELLVCAILTAFILKRPLFPSFNLSIYKSLFREALPQMGVVLLDSSSARIDWILMGIISTNALTGDYSFSYKAFESSRIPLMILAPVLLPKISRLYGTKDAMSDYAVNELNKLWKAESVISLVIPLILNICWVDLVNIFTHNRYGQDTQWLYAILSVSIPMMYITNYLWNIAFAQGKLKLCFKISLLTTITNFILNIVLIPRFNALGAAIAWTACMLLQMLLYMASVKETRLKNDIYIFLKTFFIAVIVIVGLNFISISWILKTIAGLIIYVIMIQILGILDLRTLNSKLLKSGN